MQKLNYGIVIICLGIASLSVNISMAILCKYIEQGSGSFYEAVLPYVQAFSIPIILSVICIITGIVLCFKND